MIQDSYQLGWKQTWQPWRGSICEYIILVTEPGINQVCFGTLHPHSFSFYRNGIEEHGARSIAAGFRGHGNLKAIEYGLKHHFLLQAGLQQPLRPWGSGSGRGGTVHTVLGDAGVGSAESSSRSIASLLLRLLPPSTSLPHNKAFKKLYRGAWSAGDCRPALRPFQTQVARVRVEDS